MLKDWLHRREGSDGKRSIFAQRDPAMKHLLETQKAQGKKPLRTAERHKLHITFVGEEGRKWRLIAVGAVELAVLIAVAAAGGREPQLFSKPEISSITQAGVLKVGVREDMAGLYKDGRGLEADLSLLLAERILPEITGGNAVKYVPVTGKTALPKLQDGSVDVVCALMPRGASAQYAYSVPYLSDRCRFIIREGTTVEVREITIGVIQKSPEETMLNAYIETRPNAGLTKQNFASYDDLLTALSVGRINAAVITDIYLEKYRRDYSVETTSVELGQVDYAFVCAGDQAAVAQIADLIIGELQASGELARMYARYDLPISEWPQATPAPEQEK